MSEEMSVKYTRSQKFVTLVELPEEIDKERLDLQLEHFEAYEKLKQTIEEYSDIVNEIFKAEKFKFQLYDVIIENFNELTDINNSKTDIVCDNYKSVIDFSQELIFTKNNQLYKINTYLNYLNSAIYLESLPRVDFFLMKNFMKNNSYNNSFEFFLKKYGCFDQNKALVILIFIYF